MVPVLQCLTPPCTSQLTRLPAWPCPFVFPAQCSICPLGKLPGNTPISTSPSPPPPTAALNTLLLCHAFRLLEACTLTLKLIGCSYSLSLCIYPLYHCYLALFCVCLAYSTIVYNLCSHCLSSSAFRCLPHAA